MKQFFKNKLIHAAALAGMLFSAAPGYARPTSMHASATVAAANEPAGVHHILANGKVWVIDANGNIIRSYDASSSSASSASLGPAELLPGVPGRVSTPGRGYDQAAAIRAQNAQPAPPVATQNNATQNGTAGTVATSVDQNAMINGMLVAPTGAYFFPQNTTNLLNAPVFPLPTNVTVGSPLPGQITLPTGGPQSFVTPSGNTSVTGFITPGTATVINTGGLANGINFSNPGTVQITGAGIPGNGPTTGTVVGAPVGGINQLTPTTFQVGGMTQLTPGTIGTSGVTSGAPTTLFTTPASVNPSSGAVTTFGR
jgi:hypothetical protein